MNAEAFATWLERSGAHHDVVRWARDAALGWPDAWKACPRGDWLLALALRAGAEPGAVRALTVELAALVEEDLEDPALAAALTELRAGLHAPFDAQAFAVAAEARAQQAGDMAHAFAWNTLAVAARSFDEPDAAALVPAHVAEVAMASVLDCAMMSALAATHARTADLVRARLPAPALAAAAPPSPQA